MKEFEIVLYQKEDGKIPISEFINSLDKNNSIPTFVFR